MGNLRKIVGVALAVAVVAAIVVYVLIPKTGTTTNNVVVKEPQNPTGGGSGGNDGSGSTPTPSNPPPTRPPKAHGQNSHGPNHLVCLPAKNHPGNGVSQYQGANQYRGLCPSGFTNGAQGHGHHASVTLDVAAASSRTYAALPDGVYGNL